MTRALTALIALATAAAPAAAANYSARPAVPASGKIIARDISWNCGSQGCLGATELSRPVVLCQSLAKRAGRIDSFLIDGRAIAPAELERCNASAKAPRAVGIAAN